MKLPSGVVGGVGVAPEGGVEIDSGVAGGEAVDAAVVGAVDAAAGATVGPAANVAAGADDGTAVAARVASGAETGAGASTSRIAVCPIIRPNMLNLFTMAVAANLVVSTAVGSCIHWPNMGS